MSLRNFAGRAIHRLALVPLLERTNRRRGLLVLGYHRIGVAEATEFDEGVFTATQEELADQLTLLAKRYRIATLDEAIDIARATRRLRGPVVLITFDDGYLDNYAVAFPVLRSLGVPAVFFVVSSLLERPEVPWWDRVAHAVRRSEKRVLRIRYPFETAIDLPPGRRSQEIGRVLEMFKDPRTGDSDRFLRELEQECAAPAIAPGTRLFLNVEEAREMASGGMAIGSHTRSHRILAKLPFDEQCAELAGSRSELQRLLGTDVDALAYPVGDRNCFDARTKEAARAAGYRAAFSYYGGVNRPGSLDAFDVRRTNVFRGNPERFRFRVAMPLLMDGHWY